MSFPRLTSQQVADFQRDGYVIARQFFNAEETERLYATATSDDTLSQHAYGVVDQSGRQSKLALWFTPGDDLYGRLTRSRRMVDSVALLLDSDFIDLHCDMEVPIRLLGYRPERHGRCDRIQAIQQLLLYT